MKVLFIAPLPGPITGQAVACQIFLDELRKRHAVDCVDLSKREEHRRFRMVARVREVIRIVLRVWRKQSDADLIYFTPSQSVNGNLKDLLIYLACIRRLARMVVHLHGGAGMRELLLKPHPLRFVNEFFLRRIGAAIVLGQRLVDVYSRVLPPERIHIVANCAADDLFVDAATISQKFSTSKPLRVLFLSNLIEGKGHEELASAFLMLEPSARENLVLDFAGGFDSIRQQEAFLSRIHGVPGITYHGIVRGDARRQLLQSAHVLCLPSYYRFEGQPLTILEAYAAGCAVITTNHSGIFDTFVPEVNGLEVAKRSSVELAASLQRAQENPGTLQRMATCNLRDAENHYRPAMHTAAMMDVLDAVGRARGRRPYQVCSSCIMDTSDSGISFDADGRCDYCRNYVSNLLPHWQQDSVGEAALEQQMEQIRRQGSGKEHDCLIGISGGVDSSYVTYLAKEKYGLRPLLFHVDAGWNSQQAVNNVEKLVDALGLDLHTEVVNWLEMRDLQLSFFKAQVPHLDTPQDHAFFAGLYNFAAKHGFKYILTGANFSTECVREPLEWHYHASDLRQLMDIHRKFGSRPLTTFPLADIFTYKLYYRYFKGVRVVKPLNSIRYVKEDAMRLLVERFGWQRYAQKHYESRFTRFYEGYWLPTKFGYDKRRAHYSSLILTNQLSREDALAMVSRPAYDAATIAEDFEYVATKLDLSVAELRELHEGPNRSYRDYRNSMALIGLGTRVLRTLGVERVLIR